MLKLNYSFAVLCLGLVSSMVACTPAPKNPKQPSFPSTEETQWEEKRKRLLKEAENQTRPNNSTQGVPYVNPYEAQQRAENARAEESRKNAEAQRAKLDQSFKEALAKLEEVGLSFVEQGGTISFRSISDKTATQLGIGESSQIEAVRAFIPIAKAADRPDHLELVQFWIDQIDFQALTEVYNSHANDLIGSGLVLDGFSRCLDPESDDKRFDSVGDYWNVLYLDLVGSLASDSDKTLASALTRYIETVEKLLPVMNRLLESKLQIAKGQFGQTQTFLETEVGEACSKKIKPFIDRVLALDGLMKQYGLSIRDAARLDFALRLKEKEQEKFSEFAQYGVKVFEQPDTGKWTFDRSYFLSTLNQAIDQGRHQLFLKIFIERYSRFLKALESLEDTGIFNLPKDDTGPLTEWRQLLVHARRVNAALLEVADLLPESPK